jgi:hypothetical protein
MRSIMPVGFTPPPGILLYGTHISITTPVVSALKKIILPRAFYSKISNGVFLATSGSRWLFQFL